jgi:hypothetical protein
MNGIFGTKRNDREGQTLALFALVLVVLLGVSALAIDYGTWLLGRRNLQNTADAAVLAGASQLTLPAAGNCTVVKSKQDCARESAWTSLNGSLGLGLGAATIAALGTANTAQGSPSVQGGYRIWVDTPASAAGSRYPGAHGASQNVVFVWVERDAPSLLGRVVGKGATTISAWASADSERPPQPAITALCGSDPNDNSDCTGGNKAAVKVNTNNGIRILGGGDFVSDKGLIVTAGPGISLDTGVPYIVGSGACSPQTWSCPPSITGGITDTASPAHAVAAVELVPKLLDPLYAQPAWVNCTAPAVTNNCVPVRGTGASGTGSNYTPGSFTCNGNGANACGPGMPAGGTSGTGAATTCTAASPRLAPGYYDTIRNLTGCIVLDAASPGTANSYTSTTGLWRGQRPGIYRIRTSLNVNFVVGDGVTIFMDPGASLSVNGALILNTNNTCGTTNPNLPGWSGAACATTDFSRGAWSTAGTSPWDSCGQAGLVAPTRCVTLASNYHALASGGGIAIFVRPPTATELPGNRKLSQKTNGSWTTSMFAIGGGAWLRFLGTLYAPRDNVTVAGNPDQASSGVIIAWTITYSGTAQFVQTYTGSTDPVRPYLIEPTIGQ